MNQKCEHIVLGLEGSHVVLGGGGVYPAARAAKHPHNCLPEPVEIQIDIDLQRLIGLCAGPVALALPPPHRVHHRLWVVDMDAVHQIAVVPSLHVLEIHTRTGAQSMDLLLCKTEKHGQLRRVKHGVFLEDVQGRMLPILLDGQDSRHIC